MLVKYVWSNTGTGDTLYSRRDTIKKAPSDLDEKTVWHCKYDKACESVYIKRTKLGQQVVKKYSKPAG